MNRISVEDLLAKAVSSPTYWQGSSVSETLYLNFLYANEVLSADLAYEKNSNSRITFDINMNDARVELVALVVDKKCQNKGIGSILFAGMLSIIEIVNEYSVIQGCQKISTIFGELNPYEPPFDEYEKSIPFYIKQAKLHNIDISFYEEDENTFERIKIEKEEARGLIDTMSCGGFVYTLDAKE